MLIDPESLRFYVDESAPGLGKVLAQARRDVVHVGHPLIPECPFGVPDTEWIPAVADRGLVAIGRDKHIRTRPAELLAIRASGLRVVRIGGKRDLPTWEWLTLVVRRWQDIEHLLHQQPHGPWIYTLTERALRPVPLPEIG